MCLSFRDNRQYAKRDPMKLDKAGGHYSRHVSAMTAEGLHEKSDIAAELAVRDALIDDAKAVMTKMAGVLKEVCKKDWDVNLAGAEGPHPGPLRNLAVPVLEEYERVLSNL